MLFYALKNAWRFWVGASPGIFKAWHYMTEQGAQLSISQDITDAE